VEQYGRRYFGAIASPYLSPYIHNMRYLDIVFRIRKEKDGTIMIGNFRVEVDEDRKVHIRGQMYKGTRGLWELLTRKNVNRALFQLTI
jgi:hypothetical protein